jgi:hypothetical protein
MDTPAPITVQPAKLNTARLTCEQIYNDYRYSNASIVDLMVAAYDYAKIIGRAEAFQEALEINARTAPPKADPKADDERGILDLMQDLKTACDHFDAIKQDRKTLAREVNGKLGGR